VEIVTRFLAHFGSNRQYPEPQLIREIWQRLGNIAERFSRNKTLAVIYMLHVETALNEKIPTENGQPHIPKEQWEIIEHFGDWVDCGCNCGLEWSWANGVGLTKDTNKRRDCVFIRYSESPSILQWRPSISKGPEFYKYTRRKWYGKA
jgi:hypothetical protein